MIVVDTSVIVAISRLEPDADRFARALDRDGAVQISGASVLECSLALRRFRQLSPELVEQRLDALLASIGFAIHPVTLADIALARAAHMRFGKGTGHAAQLNFGDCFSYALAKRLDVPLLFKGNDFSHTDITPAL
ncbi:MAG: VapC toxin family PIN domain ribonuclease [Devosia sp. 67-54]|uniref:type II toxin-antitoxin system VapC family toxin n=1 Tax=unclassified Devosia TaxID=196773 RepID=UPI0009622AD8|nr:MULTISPECIES: type II toxin-antitoxin system VapC family toxin [unclassified Devosia]MBN9305349.1 type II toxin-antitoxin system VapC family toxin [Devosia sp.]OJX18945.1 MAG: VapC toxin family PIN domain ribonuclease [Devosia sp. 67-54]